MNSIKRERESSVSADPSLPLYTTPSNGSNPQSMQPSIVPTPASIHANTITPTPSFTNNSSTTTRNKSTTEPKRRRVTRACDNCRQKKVKCDGKQPCIHCTVYSYKCTYDQPNVRNKRNSGIPVPAQPNLAVLQAAAAAAAASSASPSSGGRNDGVSDHFPNTNLIVCQQIFNTLLPKLKLNCFDHNIQFDLDRFQKVVSYIENKSPALVRHLNEIGEMMQDPDMAIPSPTNSASTIERQSSVSSTDGFSEIRLYLPSKETALQLIYTCWNKACVLFRFYHRPSLLQEVDLLYSLDPLNYGDRQQKFLPFFYSILACGSLFSKSSSTEPGVNDHLEDDGFKYFLEARKLIDISNVGDINSIQTIVMMIMYLQCSARLSTCYSYIGIALRSALKEGLHRNLSIFQNSKRKLDPIEIDTRKRLFYTIYKMDIYINSLLGLPRSIDEDEFDQEFPEELDDEYVTRTGCLYEKQQGRLSSAGCANHHTKLMLILSHIVKKLYPIKVRSSNGEELTSSSNTYAPDKIHNKITELELELKAWLDNLPVELKPTDPNVSSLSEHIPERFRLANYYLHLAFLNCQIMLYRPCIHFISDNGNSATSASDPRSLIRGRNCIKVARMVVKLANKMIDQNLLVGTYWFSMYTIFFSVACLVYYYHFANYGNTKQALGVNYAGILFDDDLNIDMIKKDIEIGKKVLDCLKNSSRSSLRIYNILNTLFEQLNRRTADTSRFQIQQKQIHPQPPLASNAAATSFESENVKTTFNNFKTINSFKSESAMGNDGTDTATDANASQPYAAYPKKPSIEQLFNDTNIAQFQSSAEITQDPENQQETPPLEPTPMDFSQDYIPGVFDKLDAQIFGRILPPYMLERNAAAAASALAGAPNPNDSTQAARSFSHPQRTMPPHSPLSKIIGGSVSMDDFDFYNFDEAQGAGVMGNGDGNNNGVGDLEYLDPFSSVNE